MQHAGITPKNPHQRWQFGVEIGGFEAAFFTKIDAPEFENEVMRFKPGGSISDQKVAGRMNWLPITFEKGKNQEGQDNSVLQWQNDIVQAAAGTGGRPSDYMRTVDIVEYDRKGVEIRRYRLYDAFITKAKLGEYEGGNSEATIESATIEFNWAEQVV